MELLRAQKEQLLSLDQLGPAHQQVNEKDKNEKGIRFKENEANK